MRICPQPAIWLSVFERLDEFALKNNCKPPKPPFPMVLNSWTFSNDVQKRKRWDATVTWAKANGCPELVSGIGDHEFYCVEKPTDYVVGPMGGPMYRAWDFQDRLTPDDKLLASALKTLRERWIEIVGKGMGKLTTPIKFTGDKKRRLVVLATEKENPPWGTWISRSTDEQKRRSFTDFRAAINAAILPHEVDHIDFESTLEAVNIRAIRLTEVYPVGKSVHTVIVSSIEMWVRCFWPDLAAMKRDENSAHLKDGKIRPPFRVYEIRGDIIMFEKKYDEGLPEVLIQAKHATDITELAQRILDRAYAIYIAHKMWPEDDSF